MIEQSPFKFPGSSSRTLKDVTSRRQRERQKKEIGLRRLAKQQFYTRSRLNLVHFFAVTA